jgi:hypothetical protein
MPRLNETESKSIELPNVNGKTKQSKSDRHAATASAAHQSTVQDKATLTVRTQQQLTGIQSSIDKIASDRTNAIEQVSDTLAYLYSPATFHADVLIRTAEKLGLKAVEPEPETITLDSLGDCFSRFVDSVEYPAIAASSALGCLPM